MNRIITLLFCIGFSIYAFPQDILFANKNTFASQLNPALVGALSDLSVSSVYRTQWTNHNNQGYNSSLSDVMYARGTVGAGLYIRNDWGLLNNLRHEVGVTLNNTLENEKIELRYGLKLNYIRNNLTGVEASGMSNIVNYWLGPIPIRKPPLHYPNPHRSELRSGIGGSLAIKDILLGFSLTEFNISGKENSFRPPLTNFSVAYARPLGDFTASSQLSILSYPIIFYPNDRQYLRTTTMVPFGVNLTYKAFRFGSEYRYVNNLGNGAIVNSILFKAGYNVEKLSFSYVFENTGVEPQSPLRSHELSAAWHINGRKQNSKTERILWSLF